jgi:hypothetical protein
VLETARPRLTVVIPTRDRPRSLQRLLKRISSQTYSSRTLQARWVPSLICYPPLAIAFWDGIRSQAPRYEELWPALRHGSGEWW